MKAFETSVRTLEARLAVACVALARSELANLEVRAMSDIFADQLVFQLRAHVYGERIGSQEVRYPRDWREAVKERFAPAWVKARWPVQYTRLRVTAFASYPAFQPAQGLGPAVRTYEMKRL